MTYRGSAVRHVSSNIVSGNSVKRITEGRNRTHTLQWFEGCEGPNVLAYMGRGRGPQSYPTASAPVTTIIVFALHTCSGQVASYENTSTFDFHVLLYMYCGVSVARRDSEQRCICRACPTSRSCASSQFQ